MEARLLSKFEEARISLEESKQQRYGLYFAVFFCIFGVFFINSLDVLGVL